MESPALYALISPSSVPQAAVSRLRWTSETLDAHAESARAGRFGPWLGKAARMAWIASDLLGTAITGQATSAEWTSLLNAERIALAGTVLFASQAARSDWLDMRAAMAWSSLHRDIYCDIMLTRREFANNQTDRLSSFSDSQIRILPGAEPALSILADDVVVYGSDWNTVELAETLYRWVLL